MLWLFLKLVTMRRAPLGRGGDKALETMRQALMVLCVQANDFSSLFAALSYPPQTDQSRIECLLAILWNVSSRSGTMTCGFAWPEKR